MKTSFRNNRNMTFGQLQKGDFFLQEEGSIVFVKTETMELSECGKKKVGYSVVNALCLNNGQLFNGSGFFFEDDKKVLKLYNPVLVVD